VEHLQWSQTLYDANMAIESDLHWECKANGKPQPVYRWLMNGQPLVFQVILLTATRITSHNVFYLFPEMLRHLGCVLECIC